ncbi:MAG: DNA alkylation repair protein [Myxococcota bacterium]
MPEQTPFKEWFNAQTVMMLAQHLQAAWPGFPSQHFIQSVTPGLASRELKARIEYITEGLEPLLPPHFEEAQAILLQALPPDEGPPDGESFGSFSWAPFLRYISRNGIAHFETSMQALKRMTLAISAEFDVRFFLIQDAPRAYALLHAWAKDSDWRVRRLVSEGSRPRLPWGIQLSEAVRDPSAGLSLLERLYQDPHPNVRRSVSNHLNDISKDHPALAVEVAARWLQDGRAETLGLVRHALRSRIKAGDPTALALFGYAAEKELALQQLELKKEGTPHWVESPGLELKLGETLCIRATLVNRSTQPVQVLVDYVLHHLKANGARTPKVFKWTSLELQPGEVRTLERIHRLKPVTTRAYYDGTQAVSLLLNGMPTEPRHFELRVPSPSAR